MLRITLQWGRGLKTPEMPYHHTFIEKNIKLQWGRGLKTPEIRNGRKQLAIPIMLQWGRGLKTPEITYWTSVRRKIKGFNGAGVLRPRKCSAKLA